MKITFRPSLAACQFMYEETQVDFSREPLDDDRWFTATAINDTGSVVGALFCEFKEPFNVHFSCAIADPRCMSRRLLRTIFSTLFTRAVRVTALVEPGNEQALKQVKRMGFRLEGFAAKMIEGTRDAFMFGMLREECPFLDNVPPEQTLTYLRNGRLIHPIASSQDNAGFVGFADGEDILSRQFGPPIALPLEMGAMQVPVRAILGRRGPSQMPPVDTSHDPAVVSGLMPQRRR